MLKDLLTITAQIQSESSVTDEKNKEKNDKNEKSSDKGGKDENQEYITQVTGMS
jgi:hypothetical protein